MIVILKDRRLFAIQCLVSIAIMLSAYLEPRYFAITFGAWFLFCLLILLVYTISTPAEDLLGLKHEMQFIVLFGTPIIILGITKALFTIRRTDAAPKT
ncbi:MAG: hypothetical protein AAB391_00850 [Patescibacteria group bacterium]